MLPILDASAAEVPLVAALDGLAAGGATWVEYRDKAASDRVALERATALAVAARNAGVALLVNDRVDVAQAAGADGVHLGQDDLAPEAARRLLGPSAVIGISVDTVEEARAAAGLPVDYVALGPVFRTATKSDAGPVVGLQGVAAVAAGLGKPLVAVGGIDPTNAAAVIAAGAECVAVVSALLAGARSEEAIRERTLRLIDAAGRGVAAPPD